MNSDNYNSNNNNRNKSTCNELSGSTTADKYRNYEDLPLFLTIPETCAVLKIGKNTVYDMIHCGQIKSTRFGHQIRIPKTALQFFMN